MNTRVDELEKHRRDCPIFLGDTRKSRKKYDVFKKMRYNLVGNVRLWNKFLSGTGHRQ